MKLKGNVNIVSNFKKVITLKIKVIATTILIPIIIAAVLGAGLIKENKAQNTRISQANMYNALDEGQTDLGELVEIKGDDSSGYYLEFVDDINVRLEKVFKENKSAYKNAGVENVTTLKKFIKAQLATEYPHLGARMSGSSGGNGTLEGEPDLYNEEFYPHSDPFAGQCTWFACGRIHELYGINPGGLGNGGDCVDSLTSRFSEYFTKESTPVAGSMFSFRSGAYGHVGIITAVNGDEITIEECNVTDNGSGTFKSTEGDLNIHNAALEVTKSITGPNPGWHKWTTTIEYYTSVYAYGNTLMFANPTAKALELLKANGNKVTGSSTSSKKGSDGTNLNSLEGVLFIGDSITEGLRQFGGITDEHVQFRGVVSSSPGHWLVDTSVVYQGRPYPTFSSLPKDSDSISAICVMLGTNAMGNADVAEQMRQTIEKIHGKYPEKTIYVQKILPLKDYTSQVENYNNKLQEICEDLDYAICIDSTANVELSDGVHPTTSGYRILAENTREQIMAGGQSGGKVITNPNAFQGAIRIRRIGPNKAVGEYKELSKNQIIVEDIKNEGKTEEGLGKAEEIPESVKKRIIGNTVPEDKAEVLNDLSYLTIPFVNFKGRIEEGHMIVNKEIANEVLDLFQELYNMKYPIEKMQIVENYTAPTQEKKNETANMLPDGIDEETLKNSNDTTKDVGYKSIEANNTYCFYYTGGGGQREGTTIVINPKINPKIVDGQPTHENAKKYANRDDTDKWKQEEKQALIKKDSDAYKIFEKYGWTWGGEAEGAPDYMKFEKKVLSTSKTEKTTVDTKIYDLAYVPEETFNKYIEENSSKALKVYTLDENKKLTIATWSYTTDGGLKISKGSTINYKQALSKYSMSVEYLLALLMHSESKEFAEGVADLAINSEYIIAVEDSVTTTQVITKVKQEDIKSVGVYKSYEAIENGKKIPKQRLDHWEYTGTEESVDTTKKVSETASQKIEVTYVDCWFVKYAKDFSFNTSAFTSSSSSEGEINLSGKQGEKIGDFTITAYCPCTSCSGPYGNSTATGTKTQAGLTIAVDPNVIPLGSYVYFNDHVYHAEDVGGGVKGNHIDLYMESHQEALNWGRRTMEVYWAGDVDENSTKSDKENSSDEKDSSNSSTKINPNPVTATAKIMADVTESSSTSAPTHEGPILVASGKDKNGTEYRVNRMITTTVTNKHSSISYDTGNERISGNAQKFIDLYNKKELKKMRRNLELAWLIESLEENPKTAQLSEITEYLFAQATGKQNKTNTLVFEDYKPGEFKEFGGTSGLATFKEYLHAWEGCGSISEDGTCYIVGDDGAGHPTVGYGIDIYNSGFLNRFKEAGYDVSMGAKIPIEFVDALEDEEIRNAIETLEANCAGLNLTQYQKYALVSRMYNCGGTGAGILNGRFESAYNSYWNQDTDDEYKVPMNEGMFNHPLYTNLMHYPNTAQGYGYMEGLENRRRSEWILFKTGYYDRIDKWCTAGSGDLMEAAFNCWEVLCTLEPEYSASPTIPLTKSTQTMNCSAFISWILSESGYPEFQKNPKCAGDFYDIDWQTQYGWEVIQTKASDDILSMLQPGDIVVRKRSGHDPSFGASGHIQIVVDVNPNGYTVYDAGDSSFWKNNPNAAPIPSGFALDKSTRSTLLPKIIRVKQ